MTPTRTNISKIVQGQREPQIDLKLSNMKNQKKKGLEKESMASPYRRRNGAISFTTSPHQLH